MPDTRPWASRPREGKGVKSRKWADSLRAEVVLGERNDCSFETCQEVIHTDRGGCAQRTREPGGRGSISVGKGAAMGV